MPGTIRGLAVIAIVVGATAVGSMARVAESDIASLAAAERAFARMSVQTSQRTAFLANFADEGVWFTPAPSKTRADLLKTSEPAIPGKRVLDWEPATGDIAASGELGYTTGPYHVIDSGKVTAQGWFFSVWRRTDAGPWRVMADFGIGAPDVGTLRPREFKTAEVRAVRPASTHAEQVSKAELIAAERAFAAQASREGLLAAYRAAATEDVRVYRPDTAPIAGRVSLGASMPTPPARLEWDPQFVGVSNAHDLAYTYGAYTTNQQAAGLGAKGFYLHVWKRRPEGWRLATDVVNVAK
jgi:ketosteroid isomerase-like protein